MGSISPSLQRTRSRRINFKVSPLPHNKREVVDKENVQYSANRVSPKNRPWAKRTVLYPNPLFQTSLILSSSQQQQHKFCKTRSPVITRTNKQQTTPHKFLIKSPPLPGSKFQVRIKSPPPLVSSLSPTRMTNLSKKSPKMSTASKLHRSFSPSRPATRLVSPLRSRKSMSKNEGPSSRLKQCLSSPRLRISAMRI